MGTRSVRYIAAMVSARARTDVPFPVQTLNTGALVPAAGKARLGVRSPYSGVITSFADRLANGEPIQIFGDGHA
jgi:hypothetical protein